MAHKQRLLVYPYDNDFLATQRHSELLCGYEIVKLVSPSGWGLVGKDSGSAGKCKKTGIAVSGDFKEALKECDTVLFVDSHLKLDFGKTVYPKMLEANTSSRNILCGMDLGNSAKEELSALASSNGTSFSCMGKEKEWIPPIKNEIYNIDTSVIFILGIAERTNKFEIQLALRKRLLNEGYKVSQIGTKNYCELFGFHSMPCFMYGNSLPEAEKITLFNHYVKKIEKSENPDVIIIGLPGGTMKFNSKHTNQFGIMAYEISQAVTPDAAVCSVLYEEYKPVFFENVLTSLKYKLGFTVDCFNISNYQLDWIRTDASKQLSYTLLESNTVTKRAENLSGAEIPVYNILDENHADEMSKFILGKLSRYAEVSAF